LATTDLGYTSREQSFVAWSTVLGYAFDFYNLIIMAFLLTQIQTSLGMTLPQTGLIVSMTLTGSVIGGVGIGWLGDKIGRKNALLASLGLLAAGSILSALAWNFSSLLFFRFFSGIGVGGEWGAGVVLLNEVWRSEGRGFGSGIVQAMSAAGTAMAVIVATLCLSYLSEDQSWRVSLLIGGLPIFLMLFVRAKMPESRLWSEYERLRKIGQLPNEKATESSSLIEIFRGASRRYFILGALMCGAYIISYQAISIFMPTLMIRGLHADLGVVRTVTLLWSTFSATGLLLAGLASDRIGGERAIIASTCICLLGFVAMVLFGQVNYPGSVLGWPLFWGYALWGLGQGSIGVFGPWYSELFPVALRSTGASTTFTAGRLIGSAMPYQVPMIAAQLHDLFTAMMFGAMGASLSLLFALFLPETAGRKFSVIESKEHGWGTCEWTN
jgi:predicted MFS family arabinose efflux permease